MRVAVAVSALSLALVACSNGDGGSAVNTGAKPGREVAIAMTDTLRFQPAAVNAKAGETLTFVITNDTRSAHDFSIGSQAYQDEAANAGGHGGGHGGTSKDGATVAVSAGKTARLTYTMPATPPGFACHVDNHDEAGMKGTVVYV